MAMTQTNLPAMSSYIRQRALSAIYHAGSGHPGGSLSCADILAQLFGRELRGVDGSASDADRDRFVLSKGHACPAVYAAAAARGWLNETQVKTLRKLGSALQGHPHVGTLPWLETSTGSLGQGFSTAVGMALGLRMQQSNARVYVLLGDGELQEGQVWEAALSAAHYGLGNLCAIVDYNKLQSDDYNANIMNLEPLGAKWQAFNWHVIEVDGHDHAALTQSFAAARAQSQPQLLLAHTIKGRGVSYMQGVPAWHGSVKLRTEETQLALAELGASENEITAMLQS